MGKELPLKVGQRIAWEIEGDRLIGRRVQSISELAGRLRVRKLGGVLRRGFLAVAKTVRPAHP